MQVSPASVQTLGLLGLLSNCGLCGRDTTAGLRFFLPVATPVCTAFPDLCWICCTCVCLSIFAKANPLECHLPLSPCRRRSWFCLLFLVLGAAGYVMVDSGFEIRAYFWLLMWYFFFVFDAVSWQPHSCSCRPYRTSSLCDTVCVRKDQQHHVPPSGF